MGSPYPIDKQSKIIVLFDGVCNLCNGTVQFIIKRDPKARFIFASLQSDFGIALQKKFGLDPSSLNSFFVIEDETLYQRSDAALHVAGYLNGIWPILRVLRFIPRFIRDTVYNTVSSNRYRIFGKTESCTIPTPKLRARFIQ